ncbi:hypothetical protein [Capnocytophaga canis]|uniref:Uncharacterized protein n=1 Tax=Capnocytophaga canis TaxID=1848903 RepID=A0A0B7IQY0_9FLAO|nr:hypothetical protein [Capnocytophaga canis]CEN53019.1 hypothetical protein CCAND93_350004 [Capnocytophaga canis]
MKLIQQTIIDSVKLFLKKQNDKDSRLTFLLDKIFCEFYKTQNSIRREDFTNPKLVFSIHSKKDLDTLFTLCKFFTYKINEFENVQTIYVESLIEELRYLKDKEEHSYVVMLRLSASGKVFFISLLNEIVSREIPYNYGERLDSSYYF